MSDAVIFTALAENAGDRIDKLISEKSESLSRSAAAKIIEEQGVTVNGSVVSKNYKCKENDKIVLIVPQAKPLDVRTIAVHHVGHALRSFRIRHASTSLHLYRRVRSRKRVIHHKKARLDGRASS